MKPEQFKAIRTRARLSQSNLATILRISDGRSIRRWEDGTRAVSGPVSLLMEMIDAGHPLHRPPQHNEGEA